MASKQTGFSSNQAGFRFVNAFDLLPNRRLPKIGRLDLDQFSIIGLCGGMCFAALDFYLLGRPAPRMDRVEALDPDLLGFLRKRQSDSVPVSVLARLVRWLAYSDEEVQRKVAQEQVPVLRRLLDKNLPVVLLLVRTKGVSNLTLNHQVLATGYDFDEETGKMTIHLYDPNHPSEEPALLLDLSDPTQARGLRQTTGEALRGFFIQKYQFKQPPIDLLAA